MMKSLQLYLDTSIPNHLFAEDTPERMAATKEFFKNMKMKKGACEAYISEVVLREVMKAPSSKRDNLLDAINDFSVLELTAESVRLAEAYIREKIIPPRYEADALHLSIAAVHGMNVISWNFEHMVNLQTRRKVNAVNELMGYRRIEIVTPEEVNWNEI